MRFDFGAQKRGAKAERRIGLYSRISVCAPKNQMWTTANRNGALIGLCYTIFKGKRK